MGIISIKVDQVKEKKAKELGENLTDIIRTYIIIYVDTSKTR